MTSSINRPLPLHIPLRKNVDFLESDNEPSSACRALSPDIPSDTPPVFPTTSPVERIGKYLLTKLIDSTGAVQVCRAIHCETGEEFVCKIVSLAKYRTLLAVYTQASGHPHVNCIHTVIVGATRAYLFFAGHYGDLHSYVRARRRLRESEASRLLKQVVAAVVHCHERGIVLRDLKLRKFVFKDAARTQLKLESLEDACVLRDPTDDRLTDRYGCPAYVSPEIVGSGALGYSGKAADAWSLGVMAYTTLVGRYPFRDAVAGALFGKIRRGQYTVPDALSSRARCLIRSLLRREPHRRLTPAEVLRHPWLTSHGVASPGRKARGGQADQMVPDKVVSDAGAVEAEDLMYV